MTQFTTVEEWLNSIKMTRYLENFERAGITSMDAVVRVTVKELTALGITLVGHQKKIMNSVQAMRAQISANLSEGFLVWLCTRAYEVMLKICPTNKSCVQFLQSLIAFILTYAFVRKHLWYEI